MSTILAVLDDLMFSSKIRAAAGPIGAPVTFARSGAAALEQMRKTPPSLVIFDLNSTRADALATVAAMKADPALAGVKTLGFASHTQVEVLRAARAAGLDEVLTRGTFASRVADILGAH
jgi:CheY-like chemotaxis protein